MGRDLVCSNCGSAELVQTDRHPATVLFDAEKTEIKFHTVYRCGVCKNIQSDCERTLPLLVYYNIEIESVTRKFIEHTPCEYISNNMTFLLARIVFLINQKNYNDALDYAGKLIEGLEKSDTIEEYKRINYSLISAYIYHLTEKYENVRKTLRSLSDKSDRLDESLLFVYQLLELLANENRKNFKLFMEKWFDDYKYPFDIPDPPERETDYIEYINANIDNLYAVKGFFDNILIPLFNDTLRKYSDWSNTNEDYINVLDNVIIRIYTEEKEFRSGYDEWHSGFQSNLAEDMLTDPFEDEDIRPLAGVKTYKSYSNVQWYKQLKKIKDQLCFDIYIHNDLIQEAFEYYETNGISHIRPIKNRGYLGYNRDQFFEVSLSLFPYPTGKFANEHLFEYILPDYQLQTFIVDSNYSEVVGEVLKYWTIVDFYDEKITEKLYRSTEKLIKNRLLDITDKYLKNPVINRDLKIINVPPIVLRICEEQYKWQKAYELLLKSGSATKYKELTSFDVDGELFASIRNLSRDEQRQLLVYIKIIVQLEPALRNYIRKNMRRTGKNVRDSIVKYYPDVIKRIGEPDFNVISGDEREDELDWLTLPQLFELLTKKELGLINDINIRKRIFDTAIEILSQIRNRIAHAVKINEHDISYATRYVNELLKNFK